MTPTEHTAKTPSVKTGRFALPFSLLRGGGSGAPSLRPAGLLAALALAVTALLALAAAPASALTTRQLETQITGTCPSPGNCTAAERIPFAEPEGLTVDSSDRLWVTDDRRVVDRFGAAGAFEAQNTGAGSWEEGKIRSLAFSAAADEVFVADSTHCALWGLDTTTAAYTGKELRPFGATEPCSLRVAADNSAGATDGDLYAATPGTLLRIKASDGSPDEFTAGPGAGTNELGGLFFESRALAVAPNGDFYWGGETGGGELRIEHFAPTGELIGEITEAAGQPIGFPVSLTVDPTSEALLAAANNLIYEFDSAGTFQRFITKPAADEFHGLSGLAADSTGHLYASEASGEFPKLIDVFGPVVTLPDATTLPAEVHSTTEATLHGEVNPAGQPVTECFFEYGPTTAYGQTAQCEPAAALGEGTLFEPVHAALTNLTPGTVYHYRLVAADAEGTNRESEDREFVTGATIDATSASEVTATSAVLETEVNPRGLPTTYSFQYGTTTAYGSETPMPPAPLGAGSADVARSAAVSSLAPSTTYHFRVLATNSLGTVAGPDRTFTTQPAISASGLPDSRGYELVSPPDKQGIPLGPIASEGSVIQAAADGGAITYYAKGSVVSEPAGNRSNQNSQDLSTRAPAGGWSTQDISTPHQAPAGFLPGESSEYRLFSPDLSLAALEPVGATPLSPLASEKTPYLRLPDGSYEPLVYPGNVPAGTHFGGTESKPEDFGSGVKFLTATPDLSHLLLESPTALVQGFDTEGGQGVYEWSAGMLTPVSWVPPAEGSLCGGTAPACVPGGSASVGNSELGRQFRNAISTDGSRVFFNVNVGFHGLYLRDQARGETVLLDAGEGCGTCESGGGVFQIASADGSRVFFTDNKRLTADSTAAPGKPDLYMCQIEVSAGHLACVLRDLTVNAANSSEPASVQGAVIGAAAGGSSLYFVANGALTTGAVSGNCEESNSQSASNRCNLYRYDLATESLRLLAVLPGADSRDWAAASAGTFLSELTARVSPNGEWLAFMSERSLTGYDNRDAVSGEPDEEVFFYDAQGNGGTGTLLCASCNPSGARPRGRRGPSSVPVALVDGLGLWANRWYAANLPGWTSVTLTSALYQSRYLSNSGRLFFNASDALVPADSNGTEDVYTYEPPQGPGQPASNQCTTTSAAYSPKSEGCVNLISSGTSAEESAFMDASESGDDVFFLTGSRLTAKDEDRALDLYDARAGGGEAPPVKPVECSGDACQQPATPPNDQTPGSLTFNGPGDLLQCAKGKVKRSGKCAKKHKAKKKHHKRKGHKKHKRAAGHNRGGSK